MAERQPVKVYIRVQGQDEICIGTARTMSLVPTLLEVLAAKLRAQLQPDELEKP